MRLWRSLTVPLTLTLCLWVVDAGRQANHTKHNKKREHEVDNEAKRVWSAWGEFTECSRECGGGIMYKERTCLVKGSRGSEKCKGPARIYRSCNTEECPLGTTDFRLAQCQRYNDTPYNGELYSWVPHQEDGSGPCELVCIAEERPIVRHAATVVDGTRCHPDTNGVCVAGECQPAGCDGILGSEAARDSCGICQGDGSMCETVEGTIKSHGLKIGYNEVLLLPTGSTNIEVMEESHSGNFLALKALDGDYVLNGGWKLAESRKLHVAGSTFQYVRDGQQEALSADGPLKSALLLVILRQEGHGAHFRYSYSVPRMLGDQGVDGSGLYRWEAGKWGACSHPCPGGSQTRELQCLNELNREVSDILCDPLTKPVESQTCQCEARWHAELWEACSATCGRGFQARVVYCQRQAINGDRLSVDPGECKDLEKPAAMQSCNDHVQCPEWQADDWSACNTVCGLGERVRGVTCRTQYLFPGAYSDILPDQRCHGQQRPAARERCDAGPCAGAEWIVSDWSECQGSCTSGVETRQAVCSTQTGQELSEDYCDANRKPSTERPCSRDPDVAEPRPQWYAAQWGKCSNRCGRGIQCRDVVCAREEGDQLLVLPDTECDVTERVVGQQDCQGTDCSGTWFAGPYGRCSAACGGGQRRREVLCFSDGRVSDSSQCDSNSRPDVLEDCNQQPCDDDDLLVMGGCKETQFGCCPDGITPAEGPGHQGCPSKDQIPIGLCIESDFGCCRDDLTPSLGPFSYGCPTYTCAETQFGCCPDAKTPAQSLHGHGCAIVYTCDVTAFGCCPDGITPSNGFNQEGCPEELESCDNSVYGCCPDGVTMALGPAQAGCVLTPDTGSGEELPTSCQLSLFGCCPDDVTAAAGPEFHGCPTDGAEVPQGPSCVNTVYGCCLDGLTAARGPAHEGCSTHVDTGACENTLFGCCPDGVKSATGPDHEGCWILVGGCAGTRHGCCPDGVSSATGPDHEGCQILVGGCAGTRHGCCPDGVSSAHGPDHFGCHPSAVGCATTLHGCCSDGVTAALGPQGEGCPATCADAAWGCCLDGVMEAGGADFLGCPEDGNVPMLCAHAAFGCCPDGTTPAQGPNEAGCPGRLAAGAVCGLPDERGPCSNYSIKWYFDASQGDCTRFWYGSCEGNGNRFDSKEDCRARCIKPKGIDRCYLPSSTGTCSASMTKYHYNPDTRQCEEFVYGGCLGNDNRFDSREECDEACVHTQKADTCGQPAIAGPCKGQFKRYYFDKDIGICQTFTFGGCQGNENRFETAAGCEERCLAPATKVCQLPVTPGPCKARFQRWFFNVETTACEEFVYGGCQGNGNRFSTLEECDETCHELIGRGEKDVCSLPSDSGLCMAYFERWYYDYTDGFCKQFVYGGCQGNGNRFETEVACRQACHAKTPVDVCSLSPSAGPCEDRVSRYYFDTLNRRCQQFVFGGCDGNGNNFETEEECEKRCGPSEPVEPLPTQQPPVGKDTARCLQPQDPGPCVGSMMRWYFDTESGSCMEFIYGGCEGNRNRFMSSALCRQACVDDGDVTTTLAPTVSRPGGLCGLPYNPGPCNSYQVMWYYNHATGKCGQFLYGGCGGNENRFGSREACERRCLATDICTLELDAGRCKGYVLSWYYDSHTDRCLQFVYGGCEGNANRFESQEQCLGKCKTRQSTISGHDVCALTREIGPCKALIDRWHYDTESGECQVFSYGGCRGNENNFASKEDCTSACPVQELCSLPSKVGPCRAAKLRYFYDVTSDTCREFQYGGCEGNANRFLSRASCESVCGGEATTTPRATLPPTPSITHRPVIPGDVCHLRKDPGSCTGYNPVWYFEPVTRTCRRFLYGGCGGNGNRFENRDECQATCLFKAASTPRAPVPVAPTSTTTTTTATAAATTPATAPAATTAFPAVASTHRLGGATTLAPQPAFTAEILPTEVVEYDLCLLESDAGTFCTGWELLWHFDASVARCRQFYYGGCHGNANRFAEEEECNKVCIERFKPTGAPDLNVCTLRVHKGPCSHSNGTVTRWYFSPSKLTCFAFESGECGGNANSFVSLEACLHKCGPDNSKIALPEVCSLPTRKGPCKATIRRWYFDRQENTCVDFIYGGCHGNGNNFASREKCESVCKFNGKGADVCALPRDVGPCQALQPRYYFDYSEGKCLEFQYGGCQGNLNNFKSEKECNDVCDSAVQTKPTRKPREVCSLPVDSGPCIADYLRFYYDESIGVCRPFTFGGCQGNDNRFEIQWECYDTCAEDKTFRTYKPGDCYDPPDAGPCQAAEPRWYFDASLGACQAFYYGGCDGNGNNFHSHDDCEAFCSRVSETCGVLQCDLSCPHGFSRSPDGCLQCECLDPCKTTDCDDGFECHVEQVVCVREPCPPQPVCKRKPRPGACPVLELHSGSICMTECDEDADCDGTAKCCSNGCGSICIVPESADKPGFCPFADFDLDIDLGSADMCSDTCQVDTDCSGDDKCCSTACGQICIPALPTPPACENTLFGCCPDGVTMATGWNFIGCQEEAPMIDDMDLEVIAIRGRIASLPCKARGAPTPQISWYKSRYPIEEQMDEDPRLRVLEDGTLEISEVEPRDATSYTCRAYNGIGSATRTFTLLVQVPVTLISDAMESITVTPGADIRLPCIATGNPEPQIQWLKNNLLVAIDNDQFVQELDGTLVINGVTEEEEGEFVCSASNGLGYPTTRRVIITVLGAYTVQIVQEDLAFSVGDDLRLVCVLAGDKRDVTMRWRKDDFPMLDDDDDRVQTTELGELLLEGLVMDDAGTYTCAARRDAVELTDSVQVEMKGMSLPENCEDKPWYANCKLIIEARMCRHPYFSIFCCLSCHEAGMLP